jgi:hypothetical protein
MDDFRIKWSFIGHFKVYIEVREKRFSASGNWLHLMADL